MSRNNDMGAWFSLITALAIAVGFFAGLAVLVWQGVGWLRVGVWQPLPIGQVFAVAPEQIGWIGLRKIVIFMLKAPLSAVLIFGPALVFIGFGAAFSSLLENKPKP